MLNRTAGGSGPASAAILFTTSASTIPPSTPTGLTLRRTGSGSTGNSIAARWTAGATGDSPIDQYELMVSSHDSDTPQSETILVPGTSTTAYVAVDDSLDWSVKVRAHNAAGWSPWSPAAIISSLS